MRKQEIFILLVTVLVWIITLRGRPFFGLIYFQFYTGLSLMKVFPQFIWLRIPFTTSILVFIILLINRSKKIIFAPQTWLMIALFGVMCLSRLTNGLEVLGHKYMVFFYKIIIAHFLIVNLIDTKEKLRIFLWILIISGAVLAFDARYYDTPTPYGFSKNGFGRSLVGIVGLPLLFALSERKMILKAEAMFYFIIIIYGIAGSDSRGSYLGLAAVLLLIIISNFSVKRLLIFLVITVIILSRISVVHWGKFHSISTAADQAGTGGQRIAAWKAAIKMMTSRPILGVGSGEFPNNFNKYATREEQEKVGGEIGETTLNTHNMTLQVGSENGFLGLGLFLLIILFSFKDIIKALILCRGDPELADLKEMIKAIGIALTGFFITGQLGNSGYDIRYYTLISLAVASRMITEKAKTKDNEDTDEKIMMDVMPYQYQMVVRSLLFVSFTYIYLRL